MYRASVLGQQWLRFIDIVRTYGLARGVGIAARWLVRHEYYVLVRDLTLPLPDVPTNPGLRWTPLTVDDIPEVHALNPAITEHEIRERLDNNQTGLLGWLDNTLAYYRWEAHGPIYLPYLGLTFRPRPADYFGVDSFTRPACRGRGIHSIGTLAALHRARALNCQRSCSLTAWWNMPSLRINTLKAGRVHVGQVGFWSVGIERRYFATGAARLVRPDGRSRPTEFEVMPLVPFGS
jgi:hypothetical protein